MVNLRAMIPAAPDTARRLIIAGHYDTKLFKEFAFVGANDGGSSTALPDRAGAGAQAAPPAIADRAALPRRRGSGRRMAGRPDHTYGSRYYVETRARRTARSSRSRALILVDMIGDKRPAASSASRNSTPWLTDIIWATAKRLGAPRVPRRARRRSKTTTSRSSRPASPSVDIIDLDYPPWHTPQRHARQAVSAKSFQAVGDVLLARCPRDRRPKQRQRATASIQLSGSPASVSTGRRRLRLGEDAIDDLVGRRQAALLQPEDDVRLARHRADLDLLLAADQARRHAGVDRVDQLAIAPSGRP